MRFQLEVGERQRTVDIRVQTNGYRIDLDGRTTFVDARLVVEGTWSLLLRDADGTDRSVEAIVVPQNGDGSVVVHVDGYGIPVSMAGGRRQRGRGRRRDGDAADGGGGQRVKAPMPGKIVRVLVAAGAQVQARQGLIVIEAMKMENELRAVRAGRVSEILVQEGQSVEAGTLLITVE